MKIMVTSFKRSHASTATLSAPNSAAGHHWPTTLLETPGPSQVSLGQSLVGSLPLSPGSWCTKFCLCPPRVCFPTLCKFWCLYGGVNGDLFQEVLCHTQVCWTRAPVPAAVHCWPVPPQEMLTVLSQSLWSPWVLFAQSLFEASESLWREWGLILKANLPLLWS